MPLTIFTAASPRFAGVPRKCYSFADFSLHRSGGCTGDILDTLEKDGAPRSLPRREFPVESTKLCADSGKTGRRHCQFNHFSQPLHSCNLGLYQTNFLFDKVFKKVLKV
jgi:hypothetical protein